MEDAPEAFESDPQAGVVKFAELICGRDVVYHGYHEDKFNLDNDHGDDHDWNQNFHFAGADLGCKL